MILAVTRHDLATESNYSVCEVLHDPAMPQALGNLATRVTVRGFLVDNPAMPLFLAGHGEANGFVGSDANFALSIPDAGLLADRVSFAIACHTADGLGIAVKDAGGTWCGYSGPISCLPADDDILHEFQRFVMFLRDRIGLISCLATANAFLMDYESLLDSILYSLDDLDCGMEPFLAVTLFRERLRIWMPHAEAPLASPKATVPASLF